MARAFLTAEWRNLLMANYEIDPGVLKKYLPPHTELDRFHDRHYVSLVGFMFQHTKIGGRSFPFHRHFEEVNLRFYVRCREGDQWKRGVVFIKEIVPRRMITLIANTFYKEKYATHTMNHQWKETERGLQVSYEWKVANEWNYLSALAEGKPRVISPESEEAFITEHYWGYTFLNAQGTGVYQVVHPPWKIHRVKEYEVHCNALALYGKEFKEPLSKPPVSIFLAEGSPIQVMPGSKIVTKKLHS